jgi:hypothetical protein
MYTYEYLEPNKGNIRDAAFVVIVHDDVLNRTYQFEMERESRFSDFDVDCLGEVVRCEMETANTGWVIVRSSHRWNELRFPPVSQSAII